jgi:2-polyprenyl-3-methyl-5-hydroxy-6-metoxy-1,4-benzoquinol methylase
MDRYKETFETWNKVAALYQEKFMHLPIYNETYDSFCNSFTKDSANILEIGCGPGNISKYLLSKRPDDRIEGIDISPKMIELAQANNPTASYQVMDCRSIHLLDKKYDGIICGFCLPYISVEESRKLMTDAHELLQPGGIFYVSFVEGDERKSGFMTGSTGDRTYFNYYDLAKIMEHLYVVGFKEPKVYHVAYENGNSKNEIHTIIIAKKT